MNGISTRVRVMIAAVALIGAGGAAGAAFTGTGVTTVGQAAAPQFVGGQVSQSVSGATLSRISYGFTDPSNTAIDQVTLTFADSNTDGMIPGIVFTADSDVVAFGCTPIAVESHVSICTPTAPETSQVGASSIAVDVPGNVT